MVFQCTGCEALTLQPLAVRKKCDNPKSVKFGIPTGPFVPVNCVHCDHKHHVSSAKFHSHFFFWLHFIITDGRADILWQDSRPGIFTSAHENCHIREKLEIGNVQSHPWDLICGARRTSRHPALLHDRQALLYFKARNDSAAEIQISDPPWRFSRVIVARMQKFCQDRCADQRSLGYFTAMVEDSSGQLNSLSRWISSQSNFIERTNEGVSIARYSSWCESTE